MCGKGLTIQLCVNKNVFIKLLINNKLVHTKKIKLCIK